MSTNGSGACRVVPMMSAAHRSDAVEEPINGARM
jgi:hypothetical protein